MEDINKKLGEDELEKVAGGQITEEQAMESALKRAGLTRDQVSFVKKIGLDYDYGRLVYEIEFIHNGMEYEFDVDAENGTVLKYKKDWD